MAGNSPTAKTHDDMEPTSSDKSTIIKNLQAELDQTKLQLETIKASVLNEPTSKPACILLQKAPLEIRIQIYRLLLTNNYLSSDRAVSKDWAGCPRVEQFGLSPSLLRTCRQIREEASAVLYGDNTFIAYCINQNGTVTSPLSRNTSCRIDQNIAVTKVRHWKVVISAAIRRDPEWSDWAFPSFCQTIAHARPRSVEVIVARRGSEFEMVENDLVIIPYFEKTILEKHHEIEFALKPLNLLRNIGSLVVKEEDIPDPLAKYDYKGQAMALPKGFDLAWVVPRLKVEVEGDSPCERVFLMYQNLVTYAQAFERHEEFKSDMRVLQGMARSLIGNRSAYKSESRDNPFKRNPLHPMEESLEYASKAGDESDLELFQYRRKLVLKYLEPQYQRITTANDNTLQFINSAKKAAIFLEGFARPLRTEFADAYVVLEDYANSFRRDMPRHTRVRIRGMQRKFDLKYDNLPREILLKQLTAILEHHNNWRGRTEFLRVFRAAHDDMDSQYQSISHARSTLFENDLQSTSDIDLKQWEQSGKLVWKTAPENSKCEEDS